MNNYLKHYGTARSGRYPRGSGENPYQHPYIPHPLDGSGPKEGSWVSNQAFLAEYFAVKKSGIISDKDCADHFNLSVDDFRQKRTIALAEDEAANILRARRMRYDSDGNVKMSLRKIGAELGVNESTIRGWLKKGDDTRKNKIDNVTDILEAKVKAGKIIDIGAGSETYLNVTQTTFSTAVKALKDKGYSVDVIEVPQPNSPGKNTTVKYIAPEGFTKGEVWKQRDKIETITEYSPDKGITFNTTQPPVSISSNRVKIMYKEDGGTERDGMVSIRRGVNDLSMGESLYSQVRIAVDDKYYIKGMAIYDDRNIPNGYDIVVWSNKSKSKGIEGALKPLKEGPENSDNPFGADLKAGGQTYYKNPRGRYTETSPKNYVFDPDHKLEGTRYELSAINKIKEEDDWAGYRKNLPAQFLAKQPKELIKQQLDAKYYETKDEYDTIISLTNPMVKKKLLDDFAESAVHSASHLEAAALPRQTSKVIIPVPSLKDNELYSKAYNEGEKLALVRYPHAGVFEIPIVTVTHRNAEAKQLLGNSYDAVAINKKTADILSGADFDGDTVVCIPLKNLKITTKPPLEQLKNFDPDVEYPGYDGMKILKGRQKNIQMGIVTNLITDMSFQHATDDELARAVKHSMVVIDAEKHKYDWKKSYKDNRIEELKEKYQRHIDYDPVNNPKAYGGSSTLLSRLGNATVKVPELQTIDAATGKRSYKPNPETGEWEYGPTGKTYFKKKVDKNGNVTYEEKEKMSSVSPLQLVGNDAFKLVSTYQTPQELIYASHINRMVDLSNQARKESLKIATPAKDPQAAKTYAEEVESINSKLMIAIKNKPLERQALLKSDVKIKALWQNPTYAENKDKMKKAKARILKETRDEVGSGKQQIKFTTKEWEAIQARAISGSKLKTILNNCDMDTVKKLAMPVDGIKLTDTKIQRIQNLVKQGLSYGEIADIVGVSESTVFKYKNGDRKENS